MIRLALLFHATLISEYLHSWCCTDGCKISESKHFFWMLHCFVICEYLLTCYLASIESLLSWTFHINQLPSMIIVPRFLRAVLQTIWVERSNWPVAPEPGVCSRVELCSDDYFISCKCKIHSDPQSVAEWFLLFKTFAPQRRHAWNKFCAVSRFEIFNVPSMLCNTP